jgi:NAD(P)-dependent dehydrogenase (short-subunit alcohol dehydrogenase family)
LCSIDLGEAGTVKRRVAEQVIVVSGASSGIGRAVERFCRIDTFAATVMVQNRSRRPTTCGRRFPATRALRRRPAPDERLAGEAPPAR